MLARIVILVGLVVGIAGCHDDQAGGGGAGGSASDWECTLDDKDPDFATAIGCSKDFLAVASEPLSAAIPGARSTKTVIDQLDDGALYFQNSRKYPVHHDFAAAHLSGHGHPVVPLLGQFNQTEYSSPDRRFILGALTHYEGGDLWAYEIAPYDTASAAMIETAFDAIREKVYVGDRLVFHPTSDNVAREAKKLPDDIPQVTTDDIFANTDYQPLNLATSIGRLTFRAATELETNPVNFRDIVVLDAIPNDISVCTGTITEAFQTPLSHINVLAQNRRTPNMALRGAFTDETLRDLDGEWVRLEVGAFEWSIEKVTSEEADAWWDEHRPPAVNVPKLDLSTTEIVGLEDLLDLSEQDLASALAVAIPAYGGKASHFAAIPHITDVTIRYPEAFVVPVVYYRTFMEENGLFDRVDTMLADQDFKNDPAVRMKKLAALQDTIMKTPLDPDFESTLEERVTEVFGDTRIKFRSSTNCEDLDGFTGAGLYTSASAELGDPTRLVADAVRTVWGSVWRYRAFEEREYRGISHAEVGMALLVNRAFPDEEANGVAVTANPFDPEGVEPGFYVNVQKGGDSVVLPDAGVTSDQFIVNYEMTGQPISYLAHSSLIPESDTVLTRGQVEELGQALTAIHAFFNPVYGPNTVDHFYAMDVEFKFDAEDGDEPLLYIKQARPYPGRGK
jgi:pyruvate, water dikinase